jgi:hypothetical protein
MAIIKQYLKENFSQIPNAIFEDEELSPTSKLLYCYLSSKPSNWKVWNSEIKKNLCIKDDRTVSKSFKELLNANWVIRKKSINEQGKFIGGYDYELLPAKYPDMQKNQICKKCIYGKNAYHNNSNYNNNNNSNNNSNFNNNNKEKEIYKEKEEKFSCGEFNNVLLTEAQAEKLEHEIYGNIEDLKTAVQILDTYIETKGKKYKNHYAVLGKHNWVYKRVQQEKIIAPIKRGGLY